MTKYKIARGLSALPQARAIREHVFMEEQGFQQEFDEIDRNAYHIIVYQDGVPAATGRVFPKNGEEGTWILGRIAVEKPYRGCRLGAYVLQQLEEYVRQNHAVTCFELSAQLRAKGFYEKQGYCSFGGEHMDEYCPHVGMRKTVSCM